MHNHTKLNAKTLLIFLIFLLSLVIAGLAVYMYNHKAASKPKTTESVSASALPQMISSLDNKLKDSYPYLQQTTNKNQITAGYPIPGYAFQVILPTSDPNISLTDSRSSSESVTYNYLSSALPSLEKYLQSNGFTKATAATQDSSGLSVVNFYKSSAAICQVTIYSQLVVNCAPLSQLENTANVANPLFSSYIDAAPASGTNSVDMPSITSSKTPGFTIASMDIFNNYGETRANYYQNGSSGWQLVNLKWYNDPKEDTNIMPNCQDFESVQTIRQAFTGQSCYDSIAGKVSVIQ